MAVAAILTNELDDFGRQRRLVVGRDWFLALRGSVLPKGAACPSLGHMKLRHDTIHAGTAACGA